MAFSISSFLRKLWGEQPNSLVKLRIRWFSLRLISWANRAVEKGCSGASRIRLAISCTIRPVGLRLLSAKSSCPNSNSRSCKSALVQFSVSSPAYIVGTGSDHCDHIPVPSPTRRMYQGKILVAVRMAESDHKIRLTAQSEHLGCCEFLIKPER